ncbi:hypothetical protein PTSG_09104 [Salpingoeca rosetta]|uniref:Peptidase M43 pregnancy-associated plasma-A domain-containing protein n=1 Tax=Salpingoeca rosetta (strain ATCC 50818 / BSB-021) TaxID=946362 RepID=F2UMQ9_SALR5|nr:uncharacterized protein PTSG_09104 [Salpingoeca rosetta]EGD78408.1 hypothetical protein PTSG_09104 [Salpingoeca rosetta]|eukprot:XP_004989357.1 hypothetical protein PTSG_09104 [Salpingoeca rosetta]
MKRCCWPSAVLPTYLLVVLLLALAASGEVIPRCGDRQLSQEEVEAQSGIVEASAAKRQALMQSTSKRTVLHAFQQQQRARAVNDYLDTYTLLTLDIPINYYVVHHEDGTGYVEEAMLEAQTAVMNDRFASPIDTGLRFHTNATVYINDTSLAMLCGHRRQFIAARYVILDGRDPAESLNVLVCRSRRFLGVAVFPWEAPEDDALQSINLHPGSLPGGYVADFNEGDTLVHEAGHYFGLFHVFEGTTCSRRRGDFIRDTAAQKYPTSGCPSPEESADTCPHRRGHDNIHNYMDYSTDACIDRFTRWQVVYMRYYTEYFRPRLSNAALVVEASSATCTDLGWQPADGVVGANGRGVCAESRVGSGDQCLTGDWFDAFFHCQSIGARMCTSDELMSMDNKGDIGRCRGLLRNRLVWTTNFCSRARRAVVRLRRRRPPKMECRPPERQAGTILCCADDTDTR